MLELVRLKGVTPIHRLKREGRKARLSTGKRSAVKVARCVWAGGKLARAYLSVLYAQGYRVSFWGMLEQPDHTQQARKNLLEQRTNHAAG